MVDEWPENNVILGEVVEIVISTPRKEDSVDRMVVFKYLGQGT